MKNKVLKTTVVGNYPKISEDKSAPNLRVALNQRDSGKITADQLEEVYRATIQRVIKEHLEAGIDLVTDGQIHWDDIVTPFARKIAGFQSGGLFRFFDNNVYYRRPIVKSRLQWKGYCTVDQFQYARQFAKDNLKAVIPGPFTFARMSVDEYYHNEEQLTLTLTELLRQEALGLVEAGAKYIQIDEPFLCQQPDQIDLARRGIELITEGLPVRTILFLYFGSIKPLVPELFDFPVDIIGVDVVSHPENLNLLLLAPEARGLVCGCLDGRNIKLETDAELFGLFTKLSQLNSNRELFISPSCGLEFLPHRQAQMKLNRLVESVRKFEARHR